MARRILVVVELLMFAVACSQDTATPTPLTSTSSPAAAVTTAPGSPSTMSTLLEPLDPPRLGSALNDQHSLPIEVVEEAVLRIDGSCVTAEAVDTTFLILIDFEAKVLGQDLLFNGFAPGLIPTRVLSSGARHQLRGVLVPPEAGLADALPPGCDYDERLLVLGALDTPVGTGLATHPVEVWVATPSIGTSEAVITIDGPCTTITHPTGELLVIWPEGSVSLVDDHTIHFSRWESLSEIVIRSGDIVDMQGAVVGHVDDPPPGCEFDGYFTTGGALPPRP